MSANGSSSSKPSGSAVKTPPKGSARPKARDAKSESLTRSAFAGREVEFWGVAFISVGILMILSMYLHLAGPVGRALNTSLGWLLGLGRFALPVVIIGIGVAMVRRQEVEHRVRLSIGWGIAVVASLGFLHLANGPNKIVATVDAMSDAGGWLGAVLAEPLRSTIGWAGAFVLLSALMVSGVLLITDVSLPELIAKLRAQSSAMAGPASQKARDGIRQIGRSDQSRATPHDDLVDVPGEPDQPWPIPTQATLYDAGLDPDFAEQTKKSRKTRNPETPGAPATPEFHQKPDAKQENFPLAHLDLGPSGETSMWVLPDNSLLSRTEAHEVDEARVNERGKQLQESLASHGVETRLVRKTVGPTVTRFELELGLGVKVARVTSLNRDIAYSMAAVDVRILAPIPGKSAIGVEVPNESRQLVSLGDLITSPEARAAVHPLDVAIGKDIGGRAVFLNLATTPHLLIAGATGAGKSSCLNSIITSLLMRTTPDQVRMILIDPKQVEMGQYARLPHLLTAPVTNPKKAANALSWAVKEMERRYDLLVEVGFRDITGYNASYDRGEMPKEEGQPEYKRLPYIVIVVDELNDLMIVAARDVEESITRIAQKARAVGVHLIVATQRPSVNVITGVIKANIPARMAFAVSSLTDSRVILDQIGAEKLIGQGDMLLLPGNSNVANRIQGSWVTEDEVRKVVAHWRRQAPEVVYVTGIEGDKNGNGSSGSFGGGAGDDDDLLNQAIQIVVRSGVGSTSLLQRKLKVGFARAGRLMDLLEERGIVGPSDGSKARAVMMSIEELESSQQDN
ncbi:MAG: DNA translocase FtsK [Ilumatobacteraceae bacterium]|nr:DNA translocase FtsK [Ilumatobacteraceae bacterium]